MIDWDFLRAQGLENAFLERFQTDAFTVPQWERLFREREPVYSELVREFFATFHFDLAEARTDMGGTTIYFMMGVSLGLARLQSLVGDWVCIVSIRLFRMGLCRD